MVFEVRILGECIPAFVALPLMCPCLIEILVRLFTINIRPGLMIICRSTIVDLVFYRVRLQPDIIP